MLQLDLMSIANVHHLSVAGTGGRVWLTGWAENGSNRIRGPSMILTLYFRMTSIDVMK